MDTLEPDEVWILKKGDDGFSMIHHASEDTIVKDFEYLISNGRSINPISDGCRMQVSVVSVVASVVEIPEN